MFCKHCGNIMNDHEKFCKSCGAPAPRKEEKNTYGFQQNDYGHQQNTYRQPQSSGYDRQENYRTFQGSAPVKLGDAIRLFFANFTNFSGRSRRSEYWNAALFVYIVNVIIGMILPDLAGIVTLVFFLPQLSLAVRRLHDVGKSGWFYLWSLIPLVGTFMVFYQFCKDSEPGPNRFGPSTKY